MPKKSPRKKKPKPKARESAPTALSLIEKAYGKETARLYGTHVGEYDTTSTGSIGLDVATGIGGVPRGRIIEVYGPESSGKTTMMLHLIAETQRRGLSAAFIDAEHAFDPRYAEALGVDLGALVISQPDYGEQALGVVDILVSTGEYALVVVDSVAALTPKAEIDGEIGDSHVGLQARMMGQTLRKITGVASKTGTTVAFINQLRMKIGVMFGSPETTTGGRALRFYTSMRFDCRRIGKQEEGGDTVGNRTRVRVVKNKCARPWGEAEFDIRWGHGIDTMGELIDLGVVKGVVDKSGAWFSYAGDRLGQGRANSADFLRDHPDIAAKVRAEIGA
jgi:recombination protein RecA